MHFCAECGMMLYIKIIGDENNILYYCRKCGTEETNITEENLCVSNIQFKKQQAKINHMINEFTKLDPTLPRINNIQCPNQHCDTNKETEPLSPETIYLRYDDLNMKYVYLCAICDNIWKFEKN